MSTDDILKDIESKLSQIDHSDDVDETVPESKHDKTEAATEKEYDEDEQHAMSLGWKPEGKKGAKQWLNDYPLMKEIRKLSEDNKHLAKFVEEFINSQNNEKKAKQDAELKNMRREAIKMGDVELVEQLDKEHSKLNPAPAQVDKAFTDFYEKYPQIFNPTNAQELDIKDFFLRKDAQLGNHLPPEKHMAILEEAILKQFPKYFNIDDDEELTTPVESGITSNVKKTLRKTYTERDLTQSQLEIFKKFKAYGANITIESYIEQLKKTGDIK